MRLLPRADDRGRVPAVEVLRTTGYIRDCIENKEKTKLIRDAIAAGTSQYGMQTFDQSIYTLYKRELITMDEALRRCTNPEEFKLKLQGIESTADAARGEMEGTLRSAEDRPAGEPGLRALASQVRQELTSPGAVAGPSFPPPLSREGTGKERPVRFPARSTKGRGMARHQGPWKGEEIRRTFLRFFEERGHQVVASSSLIPANDPTLLFTNAGMNQFKEIFLGREKRSYRRACSSQKCLRVSGKHNDLEQVGRTPRHHTFFEMLGNFSFGDYFKSEAIPMAWELMTRVYGLDPASLWITVFREDDDASRIWVREVGLPAGRVLRMDEADNFWSMGETGPCGPCSEIHFDRGAGRGCGRPGCGVGCSCDRFMELWNLVFMEFDRQKDGTLRPLAAPGVDTGMGLERIASVLQGVESNYDTDLLREILEEGSRLTGVPPGASAASDVSLRVIADHVRAVTFLIADGVIPANDGRGYVLRRVLRRAIRHGRMLGTHEPFLHSLTRKVAELNAAAYPALAESRDFVSQVCLREEERFAATLSVALNLFDELVAKLKEKGRRRCPDPRRSGCTTPSGSPWT